VAGGAHAVRSAANAPDGLGSDGVLNGLLQGEGFVRPIRETLTEGADGVREIAGSERRGCVSAAKDAGRHLKRLGARGAQSGGGAQHTGC
jgi:hypothetical protein